MDELFPFLICLTWENYEGYSCVIFHCFLKRIAQICSSSYYIVRYIYIYIYIYIYLYYVVIHYFLLDCQMLCWSKLFISRCKKYIIFVKIIFFFWGGEGLIGIYALLEMYVNMLSIPFQQMWWSTRCKVL